jgi:Ca-activated chloride channel family protein
MRLNLNPRRTCLVAVALALFSATLAADAGQKKDQSITLRTDLVVVDVTVTDKDGNFIRGLKPEDFAVYDDEVLQHHEYNLFEANEETSLSRPLAAVFALDISGSIEPEQLIKQKQAAEAFIRLMRPDSMFAVVTFSDDFRVLQDFTNDVSKIGRAFQKIKDVGGATRLYGAIDRSISMLKRGPRFRGGRRLRRVIVVITDGIDSVEPPEQKGLIQRANDAEVTVYSVTLPWYSPGLPGNQRIMTLLDVSRVVPLTGGRDFSADAADFTPAFRAIAEEIRSSYTIAYYPPENNRHDGRIHQIRIECKKPGAIVRVSRNSYQTGK